MATTAADALATLAWTWRTMLEALRKIVCSHSSLGSRNSCQFEDFSAVHLCG